MACFCLTLLVTGLFFKEFKLCAFDPALAVTLGIPVTLLHYVQMTLVSLTTVAAFDSVGAILAIAMLIAPGATAYLLTDRLERMLGLSVVIGIASALARLRLCGLARCVHLRGDGHRRGLHFRSDAALVAEVRRHRENGASKEAGQPDRRLV